MPHPNQHLVSRLVGIQGALLAQRLGGVGLPSAVIGSERETFLREFLSKVFPSSFRFSSGAITDSSGRLSGQVDLAVEYPFLPSFPMPASGERLLLAESVAAVIEIKSDLSAQWAQVASTVRALRQLRRRWKGTVEMIDGNVNIAAGSETTIPIIAVGYMGYNTLDGLKARMQATVEADRPDAAFVVESGCFVGMRLDAFGPVGFYALCIELSRLMTSISSASSDLLAYANGGDPA